MSKDIFLAFLICVEVIGIFFCLFLFYLSIFRILILLGSKSEESSIFSEALEHPEAVQKVINKMRNHE